jgi:dimethylargininase
MTAGPGARGEGRRALVRRPSLRLSAGLVTHIERQPVDVELAVRQWRAYVDAMRSAGWSTVEVAPADDCPDSVFIEDAMVVYGDLAVIASPAEPSRRGELPAAEKAVAGLGYRLAHIEPPGTLDGGDVLKVGSLVYVGLSKRTNEDGARQLAGILSPLGARVEPVPVTKTLHLKSAVTALPDATVIGYPELVDDTASFDRFLAVPEPAGAHVVLLGDERLMIAASAPQTAEIFHSMGYRPVVVDISEFEKLEGCVTCLSVRLRGGAPGQPAGGSSGAQPA